MQNQLSLLTINESGRLVADPEAKPSSKPPEETPSSVEDPKSARYARHGCSSMREYRIWQGMKARITNPKNSDFRNYGGRGLKMEPEWLLDFRAFYKAVGPRPSKCHTIERKNNDIGYMAGNVTWETRANQALNKRTNIRLTFNGKTQVLAHWAKELRTSKDTILERLERGWTVEEALGVKIDTRPKRFFEYRGENKTASEWSRQFEIGRRSLLHRLDKGQTIEEALKALR